MHLCCMAAYFVDIHTHHKATDDSFLSVINVDSIREITTDGYYSSGIHPWNSAIEHFDLKKHLDELEAMLKHDNVIAIGECGMDKLHGGPYELQRQLFEEQVMLSEHYERPMIIHSVGHRQDIIAVRKATKARQPWIIHGFNGNEHEVQECVRAGLFISIGSDIFHPQRRIYKTIKKLSIDYCFFETDTSTYTIRQVYERAALLMDLDLELLKSHIFANFAQYFRR